jgi:ribonuclease HII
MPKQFPTLEQEFLLLQAGYTYIAGLDEAGRGAWAGPVAAAAILLPFTDPLLHRNLERVCDSKLCTPRQRDILYDTICHVALSWAVSLVPASRIDQIGIAPATRQAMREAIARLDPVPDALLIDYVKLPTVGLPQRSIKKGDLKSLAIASASILAKVTRDRNMFGLDKRFPGYGFAHHKGYGTKQHRDALQKLGPTKVHRCSFAPVATTVGSKA